MNGLYKRFLNGDSNNSEHKHGFSADVKKTSIQQSIPWSKKKVIQYNKMKWNETLSSYFFYLFKQFMDVYKYHKWYAVFASAQGVIGHQAVQEVHLHDLEILLAYW